MADQPPVILAYIQAIAPLIAVIGGGFLAWAAVRQARIANLLAQIAAQQAETARLRHEEQTRTDYQRRITENLNAATDRLGAEKPEVRLGGIYTLERICRESPDETALVVTLLAAFVRERASLPVSTDKQVERSTDPAEEHSSHTDLIAAIEVLRRLPGRTEQVKINLRNTNLRGLNLAHVDLSGADLSWSVLSGVNFSSANLERTNFSWSSLEGVQFTRAMLKNASLSSTNLIGADLSGACLDEVDLREADCKNCDFTSVSFKKADLRGADFENADLGSADFWRCRLTSCRFEGANLSDAHLEGVSMAGADFRAAKLIGTRFTGADVGGAHFEKADLTNAIGLSQADIANAYGNAETRLPSDLERPAHWLPS